MLAACAPSDEVAACARGGSDAPPAQESGADQRLPTRALGTLMLDSSSGASSTSRASPASSASEIAASIQPSVPHVLITAESQVRASPHFLSNVNAEADEIQAAFGGPAHAQIERNISVSRLGTLLSNCKIWCFPGHGDALLHNEPVLAFVSSNGVLEAVSIQTLVDTVRPHVLCGSLLLVVLTGCKTAALAAALCERARVPFVACWESVLDDEAGRLFGRAFAASTQAGDTPDVAFDEATTAVRTATERGHLDTGHAADVQKFELVDPFNVALVHPSCRVHSSPQSGCADCFHAGRLRSFPPRALRGRRAAGVPRLMKFMPKLFGVPLLPEEYEPRPELERVHRDALLNSPFLLAITANSASVTGPAGAGKSTMAAVLARDQKVQSHFPDGVIWLPFGRERTGLGVLRTLAAELGITEPESDLARAISRSLTGQRRLLVLDDIWAREQLNELASLAAEGGQLGRLITTRNEELVGRHSHKLAALTNDEGLRILARYAGVAWEELQSNAAAQQLVKMCCGNPAMLRSVASLLAQKGSGWTLDYLESCRQKMRLARKLPDADTYGTLYDALAASITHLNAQEDGLGTKCVMLAILPEDSWVPISVVGQLWGTNDMDTKEAVMGLESWHLIDVNWEAYSLFIIDLHLDYFRATAKDDLGLWHTTLLQQSSQRVIGVFCVPDD